MMMMVMRPVLCLTLVGGLAAAADYEDPGDDGGSCDPGEEAMDLSAVVNGNGQMCLPTGCTPGDDSNPFGTECPAGPAHTTPMCLLKDENGTDLCVLACTVPGGDACPPGETGGLDGCQCPSGAKCMVTSENAKRGYCVFETAPPPPPPPAPPAWADPFNKCLDDQPKCKAENDACGKALEALEASHHHGTQFKNAATDRKKCADSFYSAMGKLARRRLDERSDLCPSECQKAADCQYDAQVDCVDKVSKLPDDAADAAKTVTSCAAVAMGCSDPGRFTRTAGFVILMVFVGLLVVGAVVAGVVIMKKRSNKTESLFQPINGETGSARNVGTGSPSSF